MKTSWFYLLIVSLALFSAACSKQNDDDEPPLPAKGFNMNPAGGVAPCEITFQPFGYSEGTTYKWNFGDGGASGETQPRHKYLYPGNYQPLLHAMAQPSYLSNYHSRNLSIKGPLFQHILTGAAPVSIQAVACNEVAYRVGYPSYSNPFEEYDAISRFSNVNFAAGYTATTGKRGMYLTRLDLQGQPVWEKKYFFSAADAAQAVAIKNNKLYAAGYRLAAGKYDGTLVCLDTEGNLLWNKTYSSGASQVFHSMAYYDDKKWYHSDVYYDDFIVTGYCLSEQGDKNILVMRIDDSGTVIWQKSFGGARDDEGFSVYIGIRGEPVLITGYSVTDAGDKNVFLAELDYFNGNVLRFSSTGGPGDETGYAINVCPSTGYCIAGSAEQGGSGNKDVYLLWFDYGRNLIHSTTLGNSSSDEEGRILLNFSAGQFIVAGNRIDAGGRPTPFVMQVDGVAKTKSWEKTYPAPAARLYGGTLTIDGGLFFAGQSADEHGYLLRTDGEGNY